MAPASTTPGLVPVRRRDLQKEQTRLELALAAFELAKTEGLANVRVPRVAEAVGVSPRTFNNYFSSKEAAIVWPATLRGTRLADDVAGRPAGEPLAGVLVSGVANLYGESGQDGLPDGWLEGFRVLVASEPALHGEYLKAQAAGERALAEVIARRTGAGEDDLEPLLLAGIVAAAERAAVLHWFRSAGSPRAHAKAISSLVDVVRAAVDMVVAPMLGPDAVLL